MGKFILDPLYGEIDLPDYAWSASKAPEVQRLREVRMCNINSLSLTGAGGVHRFEHSVGTAFLAQVNASAGLTRFKSDDVRLLTLAGLLHDVGSAGFGHSVEYVLHGEGFRHDDLLAFESARANDHGYKYKTADLEPVFFGRAQKLSSQLEKGELERVAELVAGRGRLGPLISGSIDLDNIDNVYRLAYHMGIWNGGSEPVDLANALFVDEHGLCISAGAIGLLNHWRKVRSTLYHWLLLDEDEFSAKTMLEAALRSAYEESDGSFRWHDVDYSLMLKLQNATPEASMLAGRIMTGDLFGCLGVFETLGGSIPTPSWKDRDADELELQTLLRGSKSTRLSRVGISIHYIQDVNKTDRRVRARTSNGDEVHFGENVDRTLVGVFARNPDLSADSLELRRLRDGGVSEVIESDLSTLLHAPVRAVPRRDQSSGELLDYFA
jgi:hypothetical protein